MKKENQMKIRLYSISLKVCFNYDTDKFADSFENVSSELLKFEKCNQESDKAWLQPVWCQLSGVCRIVWKESFTAEELRDSHAWKTFVKISVSLNAASRFSSKKLNCWKRISLQGDNKKSWNGNSFVAIVDMKTWTDALEMIQYARNTNLINAEHVLH